MYRKKEFIYKYVIPIIAIIFMIVWGILVIDAVKPLDTATGEQAWDVFASRGYTPVDLTDMYVEQNPNAGLIKSVTIKTDDFQLEFFIFDTLQGTLNATSATSTDIRKIEYQHTNNCIKTYVSKTNIYNMTLTAGGKYYFITRIDKTVLYAYGTEESASEILSIAKELGYTA